MEKGTRVEQIDEAARLLREAGIQTGFFLQFGFPDETLEDIERTLQMVRDCQPDDIGISVSYPLPGTPFFDRVKAQLGTKQNWVDSGDLAMMYTGSYSPAFYRVLYAGPQGGRALGTWTPYEVEICSVFYRTQAAAGHRLTPLDRLVLEAYLDHRPLASLAAVCNETAAVAMDVPVLENHRNALLYGRPTPQEDATTG